MTERHVNVVMAMVLASITICGLLIIFLLSNVSSGQDSHEHDKVCFWNGYTTHQFDRSPSTPLKGR